MCLAPAHITNCFIFSFYDEKISSIFFPAASSGLLSECFIFVFIVNYLLNYWTQQNIMAMAASFYWIGRGKCFPYFHVSVSFVFSIEFFSFLKQKNNEVQ